MDVDADESSQIRIDNVMDGDGTQSNHCDDFKITRKNNESESGLTKPAFAAVVADGQMNGVTIKEEETEKQFNGPLKRVESEEFVDPSFNFPFECQFCDKTFKSLEDYELHMEGHESLEHQVACTLCKRTFACKEELSLHLRIHRGIKPHKCKVCDQRFFYARSLEYHLQSHGAVKLFKCQQCDQALYHVSELNEHLKEHFAGSFNNNNDQWVVVRENEKSTESHNEEKEKEDSYNQEEDQDLEEEEELETRPENLLEINQSLEDEESQNLDLLVPVQSISINDRIKRENAEQIHIEENEESAEEEKEEEEEPSISAHEPQTEEEVAFANAIDMEKLFCNLCNRKMASRKTLSVHYKLVHIKNCHSCETCGMSFLFKKFLEAHVQKRKRVISCHFCALKFCSNKRFTSHMEKFHPKAKKGSASQKRAPQVVQPPPPNVETMDKHPCKDCGKIFLTLNYLHAHWGKRSNMNFRYECEQCKHRFSKESILLDHLEFHKRNPPVKAPPNETPYVSKPLPPSRRKKGSDIVINFDKHITRLADSTFKCNFCHRQFNKVNHLKCHLRYVHLQKNFQCKACKTNFPYYKQFAGHVKTLRKCDKCQKKICSKIDDFKTHQLKCQSNTARKPVKQPENDDVMEILDDEDEVQEVEPQEIRLKRNTNTRSYSNQKQIEQQQIQTPTPPPPIIPETIMPDYSQDMIESQYPSIPHFLMDDSYFPQDMRCEVCSKQFQTMTGLHLHSFTHDPNKDMKCVFCNFQFLQRSSLARHYRFRNNVHNCKNCRESFCSNLNLRRHTCPDGKQYYANAPGNDDELALEEIHDLDQEDSLEQEMNLPRMNEDSLMNMQEEDAVMEISDNEEVVLGENDCQMCMAKFNKKTQLDHHVQTKHGTVTKCRICNKSFRSPTILHIHMAARNNPRNRIKCTKCSHRFNKRSELQKHFMYHTMKAQAPNTSDEDIYEVIAQKHPKRSY